LNRCRTFAKILKRKLIYRQLTAFIFLAAFLAQTYNGAFVIADYYVNTSKYAKDCVNKARPKMHCNGKCQMMKKLQQEEKKDQENQERKSENKTEIVLSTKSFFATVPTCYSILSKSKKLLQFSNVKSTDRSLDIFHPPQA
jgi:hypothetical protein